MVATQLPGASRESNRRELPDASYHRAFIENIEYFSIDGHGFGVVGGQCLSVDRHATNPSLVSRRRHEKFRANNDRTLSTPPYNLEWIRGFGCIRGCNGWEPNDLQQNSDGTNANRR